MSDVQARIADDVKNNDVLLYMKGTPVFPQCGFSSMAVQILSHLGVKFKAVDVLADPEIRQGIKDFSNWPTIPQLYSWAAPTSCARCSRPRSLAPSSPSAASHSNRQLNARPQTSSLELLILSLPKDEDC